MKHKNFDGFTIVELLIVIVVIGILAAISVVAYNGISTRANATAIRSDLANFAKKAEIYKIDHGRYPRAHKTDLETLEFSASHSAYPSDLTWNFDYCTSADGMSYVLNARLSDKVVYVSSVSNTPKETIPSASCYSESPTSTASISGLTDIIVGLSGKGVSGWRVWTGGAE